MRLSAYHILLVAAAICTLVTTSAGRSKTEAPAAIDVVLQGAAVSLNSPYPSLDISPNDQLVIASGMRGRMRIFAINTQRLVRQIGASERQYRDAHFDQTGSVTAAIGIAASGAISDYSVEAGDVEFWNAVSGEHAFSGESYDAALDAAGLPAYRATSSADRSILAAATADGGLQLWDFSTGLPVATYSIDLENADEASGLASHSDCSYSVAVALSPDNRFAAIANICRDIRVWRLADGTYETFVNREEQAPLEILLFGDSSDESIQLLFSTDGNHLYVSSQNGQVLEAINTNDGARIWSTSPEGTFPRIARLGSLVVSYGHLDQSLSSAPRSGVLRITDSKSGHWVREATTRATVTASAYALDVSDTGKVITTYDVLGLVIWDSPDLVDTWSAAIHLPGEIVHWVVAPDGQHVLLNGSYGGVRLLDTTTGAVVEAFDLTAGYDSRLWPITHSGYEFLVQAPGGGLERWSAGGKLLARVHIRAPSDYATTLLAVSSTSDQIAVDFDYHKVAIASASTGEVTHLLNVANAGDASFSPDGTTIAISENDDALRVFDTAGGGLISSHTFAPLSYFTPEFTDNSKILLRTSSSVSLLLDLTDGTTSAFPVRTQNSFVEPQIDQSGEYLLWAENHRQLLLSPRDRVAAKTLEGHSDPIVYAAFLGHGASVITGSMDQTTRIWNTSTGEQMIQLVVGDELEDWLAVTPAGFFNFGGDGMELLAVVAGVGAYGVEQFYQALYRPDLVQELLRGDPQLLYADAASRLNLRSVLESGALPEIKVLTAEQQGDSLGLVVEITDTGGGIGNISVSVRGEGAHRAAQRAFEVGRGELLTSPGSILFERDIPLEPCAAEPCSNVVSIVVYNQENLLASDPLEITVDAVGVTQGARGTLHALVIGVDDYAPGGVRPLNYAVADATKIGEALQSIGKDFYDKVEVTTVLNADVTVANLDRVFSDLGGRIQASDKFVFYIAGHGATLAGRYYFFPQDFTYDDGGSVTLGAINQDQWNVWFDRIKARASLLLYDTCEAGTVADGNIQRGDVEVEGALNRLINALGRNVIAASSGEQAANEGYNGHGLFTWALLEAFSSGDVDSNEMIEVTELQTYIENRVPFLSREHFGIAQMPRYDIRANFPLGAIVAGVAPVRGIPAEPTHVVFKRAEVLDKSGALVGVLEAGKLVRVVDAGPNNSLVARDGVLLGYVENGAMAGLN